jgi:5-methyltetrahydrofolate--homocysteine methyltransferase
MAVTSDLLDPSASELEVLAAKRVLVKAGPSGTALLALGLGEREFRGERFAGASRPLVGNYDLLALTQPALLERIHLASLEAGADLIETNTFNAQVLSQRKFGLEHEVYELNLTAARLARRIADRFSELEPKRPRLVIGNMGPSELCLSGTPAGPEHDREFDLVRAAYAEQARALIEGGVHALLLETLYDEVTAEACVRGVCESLRAHGRALPLMLSFTPTRDGRMASGRELCSLLPRFEFARPWSFGTNCGFGPRSMTEPLEALAESAPCRVSAYPNAGVPDASGRYPEAAALVPAVADWAARGLLNVVGGCCGTTPRQLRELVSAVHDLEPRRSLRARSGPPAAHD